MMTALLILVAVVLAAALVGLVIGLVKGDIGCCLAVAFGGLGSVSELLAKVLAAIFSHRPRRRRLSGGPDVLDATLILIGWTLAGWTCRVVRRARRGQRATC
jgi:hypothetical protein